MPSELSGCPAQAMNLSVGPFSTAPRTSGETATTGAGVLASASAIPDTARIGPIEMTGFDGPMMIAFAPFSAATAGAVARAAAAPRSSTPSTGPCARWRIMNSWKENHSPRAATHVRSASSVGGSTRAGTPSAVRSSSIASVSVAPAASRRARWRHTARSRSPRLNQTSSPSARSASMTANVSPARPQPRASMRSASQNVTRSGSGETCAPWISTSSPVLATTTSSSPTTSSIPRASLAPPVPPARTTTTASHSGDLDPGVRLVAHVDRDQQGGQRLRDARHLQAPGVDAAQALDEVDQADHAILVLAVVAAHEDVFVERMLEVGARRGAHRVQRADHPHAVGGHLLGLLGGRALPHAEHARGPAADGGGQRDRGIDEELVLAQRALEVGQRLGLVAEGDAEHDDPGLGGRLGVLEALEAAVGQGRAGALGGLDGPVRVARAEHDGHAGAAPAQRQAEAERTGGPDDGNGLAQGRRVYVHGCRVRPSTQRAHPRGRSSRRLPERAGGRRD